MSKRKLMALGAGRLGRTVGMTRACRACRASVAAASRRRALKLFVSRLGLVEAELDDRFLGPENTLRETSTHTRSAAWRCSRRSKLVLATCPEGHVETLRFSNHPKDESQGEREIPFSRELWIEQEDFAEVPPKGWKRLVPGGEIRLRGAASRAWMK
jgi:glutaminyl-tRNA synthetase